MTGDTDRHLLDQKTSQFLVGPPFASCSMTHLLRKELIVECYPTPLQWLCEVDNGRNLNTLLYTSIQNIPNMLNWWHVR